MKVTTVGEEQLKGTHFILTPNGFISPATWPFPRPLSQPASVQPKEECIGPTDPLMFSSPKILNLLLTK